MKIRRFRSSASKQDNTAILAEKAGHVHPGRRKPVMRVDRSAPNDSSPPLGDGIPGCAHLVIGGLMPSLKRLLQAVLVGLDHLLDHLAADAAGLAAGQIAIIALL